MAQDQMGENFTEAEAQRRFEQALKAAVTTAPVPMKDRLLSTPPDRQAVGKAVAPKRTTVKQTGRTGG